MIRRLIVDTNIKCLSKFIFNFGIKGILSYNRFRKRLRKGDFFPAFHFISVTDDCNLNCQGCWVTGKKVKHRMHPYLLERIIEDTRKHGSYFFGILGGEPLMYKYLTDVIKKYPDCYFQVFTNGTLLTPELALEFRKMGNVTPLISFEGDIVTADIRRGGTDVYAKTRRAIETSTKAGLVTGVAISVCKSNFEFAFSADFINYLIKSGVTYLWYYIFRPVGENPSAELCLSKDEISEMRVRLLDARDKYSLMIIDTYWDDTGNGICAAASGLSHHINAAGYIEPCPVIQFSDSNLQDNSAGEIYKKSEFLKVLKKEIPARTKGCILMDDPRWLATTAVSMATIDTSGRNNESERLMKMSPIDSHGSATPIPERKWIYRFAKRKAFFGLGAYG